MDALGTPRSTGEPPVLVGRPTGQVPGGPPALPSRGGGIGSGRPGSPALTVEGYQPLPLDLVGELDELPFDVYVRRDDRMVLYAVQGADPLAVLMRARHGLDLYVPLRDVGALRRLVLSSLASAVAPDTNLPLRERARRARAFGGTVLAPLFVAQPTLDREALEAGESALDLLSTGISAELEFGRAVLDRPARESGGPERAHVDLGIDGVVYSVALAQALGDRGAPADPASVVRQVGRAAGLRDIGLPRLRGFAGDRRPLDASELATIRRHCAVGVELLGRALGGPPDYARAIGEHHERVDGSGFPAALRGNEVSLEGQIVGLADALVAIVSPRPGKAAYPASEAIRILRFAMRGRFNEDLVLALVGLLSEGLLVPAPEGGTSVAN